MGVRRILTALGVLALALVAGALFWPQDSALSESAANEEWVARYDGPDSLSDGAHALVVDGAGNVYVTGSSMSLTLEDCSYMPQLCEDYATIKYGPDGSEQWVARYDAGAGDSASALAVDGAGNVYVTGGSWSVDPLGIDYATIKYGPDGSEQWVARYDGGGTSGEHARALAVDSSGNVYVTGYSSGDGTRYDYATVKYGPDGSEEWVARYDGPGSPDNSWDDAYALAVDGAGNVYVTGKSPGSGTSFDYATIKYGPDGSEEWVVRYDVGSYDAATALAVDGLGNVYVAGYSYGDGTKYDYATIKYGPDGSEQWVARYDGYNSLSDRAYALALDGSGNVYVTGESCRMSYTYGCLDQDYATVKYGPDGSEQWIARYSSGGLDTASALGVDGSGDVYVTGESCAIAAEDCLTDYDYVTVRYRPDGSEQWAARYDGPGSGNDAANALALDGAGYVYVTGESDGSGTSADYATIKYGPGIDKDGDGCTDEQENGDDPTQGGLRDPLSFWDYGDMPNPNADPRRDRMIRVTDIMAVVSRYGTDDEDWTAPINRNTDPLLTPPKTGYHPAYDRGGQVGPNPWNQAPADGQIRVADIMVVVNQYGHDCA